MTIEVADLLVFVMTTPFFAASAVTKYFVVRQNWPKRICVGVSMSHLPMVPWPCSMDDTAVGRADP